MAIPCASCRQSNPENALFCGECGASLQAEPSCPACGRANPSGLKFCRGCGSRLAADTPASSPPAPAEARPQSAEAVAEALRAIVEEGAATVTSSSQAPHKALDRLTEDVFVGREQEIDVLRAGLEDALAQRGRLFLLAGEPGIGKTTTAVHFTTYARLRGAQVLVSHRQEEEGAPPFWLWVQIVRAAIANREVKTWRAEMGAGAVDIAHVVSTVRDRLPDLPTPPTLNPEQARFRFFDSVTTFLKRLAAKHPLVLLLDDVQWADPPSLLLLQFLARLMGDSRILIISTYRDSDLQPQHPLNRTLGSLARVAGCQTLALHGLSTAEVTRFIELTTGQLPTPSTSHAVYTETEGNPFFVREVVRLLAAEESLKADDSPRPGSTRAGAGTKAAGSGYGGGTVAAFHARRTVSYVASLAV